MTAQLEVKDAAGNWSPVAQGSAGSGLLDLLGLFGGTSEAKVEGLAAGQYRFTFKLDPNLVTVVASAVAKLSVTEQSLTDFTGEAGEAIIGNVITDAGIGGNPDVPGTGGPVTLQIKVNGVFVDPDTNGTVLEGQYGQLTISADGSYKYTANGNLGSIGQVDTFEYQLVNASGSSTAKLYIRIDTPNAEITWNPADPSAPGVVIPVANNDLGTTLITLVPQAVESTATFNYGVLVFGGSGQGGSFTVAAGKTASVDVVAQLGGVGVISGTTFVVQKETSPNVWTDFRTLTGNPATVSGLEAGTYRFKATTGSVLSAGTVTVNEKITITDPGTLVFGPASAATGNVLTDTLAGPDKLGSELTVLSVFANGAYVIPGQAGTVVAGEFGTLILFADGKYTYTPTQGLGADKIGQVDHFTYKLTSPTGESDTADLYIRLDKPDSGLVWDDANPGAPATNAPAVASLALDEQSIAADDGTPTDEAANADHTDPATDFAHVASDAGTEGLLWEGSDAAINLTDLIGKVSGIDTIDLNNVSAVDLTLSLEDLVSITGPEADRLVIQGDDQDSVHLTGNWSSGVSQVENGLEYVIYTSPEDQTHQLWVQSGITVV